MRPADSVEGTEDDGRCSDRVPQTFAGKTILITGATGFVGKVLLEKLLRTCPDVGKVFVLIRAKYKLSAGERLRKMFQSSLFDAFKEGAMWEHQISHVCAVQGDVSQSDLGLSARDRLRLSTEVEIVYHCAALLRLDETLKASVLMNVRGTECMLELAKEMPHLQLFCHISSAYCHVHQRIIYEKPYDPPADPSRIIRICENLAEAAMSAMTHQILGSYPNTYAFTKALAEGVVNKHLDRMPIILLRPSLVIPALKEPIPGWTDTINGSIGFQIAAGKGILRTLYADVSRYPDLIPVDIAANAILVASFDYLHRPAAEPSAQIFHLTTSDRHKVSWHDVINIGRDVILNSMPLNWVAWYPGGSIKPTRFLHECAFLLQHVLPAILIDGILRALGRPPILLPIYRRIQSGFAILAFYSGKQWDFDNAHARAAVRRLRPHERRKYNLEHLDIDYREYFRACTLCARRYILNEPDDTLPRARKHLRMMYYVDKLVVTLCLFWLIAAACKYLQARLG